jgi:gluconate kinase
MVSLLRGSAFSCDLPAVTPPLLRVSQAQQLLVELAYHRRSSLHSKKGTAHEAHIHLEGKERELVLRRTHRCMPPSLLSSQLKTLEEPGGDEHPIVVTVHDTVAETVITLLRLLARRDR